jgi:hypothetical protein
MDGPGALCSGILLDDDWGNNAATAGAMVCGDAEAAARILLDAGAGDGSSLV